MQRCVVNPTPLCVPERHKKRRGTRGSPGSINFVLQMKYHQLTREQRYAIYLGLQSGESLSAIARRIGVNKSTVSREVRRNSSRFGHYGWRVADESARVRSERLPGNRSLKPEIVKESLRLLRDEDWSPGQISGHMKRKGLMISHESIYSIIRSDESGELLTEPVTSLPLPSRHEVPQTRGGSA